jgi:hypothetical protein
MLGEAVWQEYLRKTGRKRQSKSTLKARRR